MNDDEKYLRSLPRKQRDKVLSSITQIVMDHTNVSNVVRLVNKKNIFRKKVGSTCIIFSVKNGKAKILRINNRNESTYKNL